MLLRSVALVAAAWIHGRAVLRARIAEAVAARNAHAVVSACRRADRAEGLRRVAEVNARVLNAELRVAHASLDAAHAEGARLLLLAVLSACWERIPVDALERIVASIGSVHRIEDAVGIVIAEVPLHVRAGLPAFLRENYGVIARGKP